MQNFTYRLAACAAVLSLACGGALAQAPKAAATTAKPAAPAPAQTGPKQIGKFDDWTAATHQEGGSSVCYAFSKPIKSEAKPDIANRGAVILTISERKTPRDTVALEVGFPYPANAVATVKIDKTTLEFYTDKRNAFARDGAAVVQAFKKASQVAIVSPGPKKESVTDTFSLKGFGSAYDAIVKACPAK